MRKTILLMCILINIDLTGSNNKNIDREYGKKITLQPLPFFRRQVEEVNENTGEMEPGIAEYPSQKIVNLLIENAEDIFDPSEGEIKTNEDLIINHPIWDEIFKDDKLSSIKSGIHENPLSFSANHKNVKNNYDQGLQKLPSLVFKRVNQKRFHKNTLIYPWYITDQQNKTFKIDKLENPKISYLNKEKKYLDLKDNLLKLDKRFIYTNHVEESDLDIEDKYLPEFVDNLQLLINSLNSRKNLSDRISNHTYTGQTISHTINSANESKIKDFEERMMELDQKYSLERTTMPMITQTKNTEIEDDGNSSMNKSDTILIKNDDIYNYTFPFIRTRHVFKSNEDDYLKMFPHNNDTTLIDHHDQDKNKIKNISSSNITEVSHMGVSDIQRKLSCIRCNNAAENWCSAPKNKLIPSIICEQENDFCYSMHTPFGVIDRGCYNSVHNMSVYVCGCNLCNYMPITELPMMFTSKQDWIQNVYELARLRSLRKNTLGAVSCLKCEVNGTEEGATIDDTNCLEGRIPAIQTVLCSESEVCGVRAARKLGYMWRGCVSAPLYNYYITLCSGDLCNLDPIVSLYDED